jgi:mRNA interferase MazF
LKRGSVVIAAERGSYAGKPRPWLIIQNAEMLENASSITACAISSDAMEASFRIALDATPNNGLERRSLVLVDKIITLRAESIVREAGAIDEDTMRAVDAELRFWLDL